MKQEAQRISQGVLGEAGVQTKKILKEAVKSTSAIVAEAEKVALPRTEKISRRIMTDAQARAEELLKEATERAGAVLTAAGEEAAEKKKQVLARTEKEAQERKRRILGMAELDARKEILVAKKEIIEEAFRMARERLVNLEEEAYLDHLHQMLLASIRTGEETVILSPRDKARIPDKFWENLKDELKASGRAAKISLGEGSADIDGGFILQGENMEINNSFNAILSIQREELEPEMAAMLFKQAD
ncbi:MAG: hypothetical protein GX318_05745 [Clostridia bacterium]|nr:hypothetical protein [Clostridia bacterium]